MIAKLTKKLIDEVQTDHQQMFIWDADLSNFGVRVTKGGRKSFVLSYQVRGGRRRRVTLGPCGPLSLVQTRQLARLYLRKAAPWPRPVPAAMAVGAGSSAGAGSTRPASLTV